MNANKVIETVEKMSETTGDGYKRIEDGVVEGYKKIEGTVVGAFNKISDKFIGSFLAKEGESVEEAKTRIADEQTKREAAQKEMIEKSIEASKNAGK